MAHHHSHTVKASWSTFIVFMLNLAFSMIEFIFGLVFNSSAILANSIHDFGDALAVGVSVYFEKLSQKEKDRQYTLGYLRFSLLGAMLTSTILIFGSAVVVVENVPKVFYPQPVNSQGMLLLGMVALVVNLCAGYFLDEGRSEQESILSLHLLEDLLGWVGVIIISIILSFTDWYFLDPLLSLGIAIYILFQALPKFVKNLTVFLEKKPASLNLDALEVEILAIEGLEGINQFNVWSIDGRHHIAMIHVQVAKEASKLLIRDQVHHLFRQKGIIESAIECESSFLEHHRHYVSKNIERTI
ncbi:cation diffusion facilitator family transporter [Streptococcus plurextorum]|uniref:cation diffusion facilitator family transporter n=1 Tax=Streptococcus plurextorum TaxID=456876 RepID=UPI000407CFC4|nr:cation diffusion facilitator family transporter [Streptococcus plurextorum]